MKATEIHPKVQAPAIVGAPFAIILVWVLGEFGVDMPSEVAAAIAGYLAVLAGYLMPSRGLPQANPDGGRLDAGHSDGGVLWTVFLILAIVALLVWIL